MKPFFLFLLLNFFKSPCADAQDSLLLPVAVKYDSTPLKNNAASILKKRVYLIAGVHATSYAGTLAILGTAWYKDYPKTKFHLFDDAKEWLQVDKAGHMWTAYNIANYSSRLWQWSGLSNRNAALLGGISSLGYQTVLEVLDAHSSQWGWSWTDMAANTAGTALFTTQEWLWGDQKVLLKFSSFPHRHYAALQPRADALFGKTFPERMLKDYNDQTYWASVNLRALFGNAIPRWLNMAIGYGATGLYGGFENIAYDDDGMAIFDRRDVKRMRQWYLSPDIDWTKIHTNKKLVRTLFTLLNMIKVPAPALELRGGKVLVRPFYF